MSFWAMAGGGLDLFLLDLALLNSFPPSEQPVSPSNLGVRGVVAVPATAKQLTEKSGVPGRRVALDEQRNSGFTRGTTSARWADHGCDTHRRATESRISAGAGRYTSCYVVFANCMVYIFEATGKPGHEWRSGSRVVHFYASLYLPMSSVLQPNYSDYIVAARTSAGPLRS